MTYSFLTEHQLLRDDLQRYIAVLPGNCEFSLHNWLHTLEIRQLKTIQQDATLYCLDLCSAQAEARAAGELSDIAAMAYWAENRSSSRMDEFAEGVEDLLIGLAVAACLELLERIGWVYVTGKIRTVLTDPRPYAVARRGIEEGIWSEDPMVLWVLGFGLQLH